MLQSTESLHGGSNAAAIIKPAHNNCSRECAQKRPEKISEAVHDHYPSKKPAHLSKVVKVRANSIIEKYWPKLSHRTTQLRYISNFADKLSFYSYNVFSLNLLTRAGFHSKNRETLPSVHLLSGWSKPAVNQILSVLTFMKIHLPTPPPMPPCTISPQNLRTYLICIAIFNDSRVHHMHFWRENKVQHSELELYAC